MFKSYDAEMVSSVSLPIEKVFAEADNVNMSQEIRVISVDLVDGAWCPWSSWQPCHQAGQSVEGGQCLCRTRSCDCPRPQFSGRPCSGKNVEVTNCTGRHR